MPRPGSSRSAIRATAGAVAWPWQPGGAARRSESRLCPQATGLAGKHEDFVTPGSRSAARASATPASTASRPSSQSDHGRTHVACWRTSTCGEVKPPIAPSTSPAVMSQYPLPRLQFRRECWNVCRVAIDKVLEWAIIEPQRGQRLVPESGEGCGDRRDDRLLRQVIKLVQYQIQPAKPG